ncbi:RHS repeat-associated core domain-containing protein [Pseudomonas sp. BW16M2]|uniref:RHS repeat-associated core domain-containing protein n=1 Tax=Pseudomonas sp. BW16M2 TaxID=2745489 RepID=UPI001EE1E604|nr:RHS repeat-associated core domain-containing protein [Pseudomonas sp. BW16M2]
MATLNLSITDWQQSVLGSAGCFRAYTPYGVLTTASGASLAYCGQLRDPETGVYHLGNGHRNYDPRLMRFHSPDRLSPFGAGGLNAYAYCKGDPVNHRDPTGTFDVFNVLHGTALIWLNKFEKNLDVALNVLRTNRRVARANELINQSRRPITNGVQPPEAFSTTDAIKAVASPVADGTNLITSLVGLSMPGGGNILGGLSAGSAIVGRLTTEWSTNHSEIAASRAADAQTFLNLLTVNEASAGGSDNASSLPNITLPIFTIQNELQRTRRESEASEISDR